MMLKFNNYLINKNNSEAINSLVEEFDQTLVNDWKRKIAPHISLLISIILMDMH